MNKYVSFVSDDTFLDEIQKVIDAYSQDNQSIEKTPWQVLNQSKETIDQFKALFDIYVNRFNLEEWVELEFPRQKDKTVSNRIGDFHQNLLGSVDGWENLGKNHFTGMDLKKNDDSIFIELKNKYNTLNGPGKKACYDTLEKTLNFYPNAIIYWAYVVSKNYESFEQVWEFKYKDEPIRINSRIKNIAGEDVYTLVTGDQTAFKQLYEAIPKAINDILGEHTLSDDDQNIMNDFKKLIFKG